MRDVPRGTLSSLVNLFSIFRHLRRAQGVVSQQTSGRTKLGPGFLEKLDERALHMELTKRRIAYQYQRSVRVLYDGVPIGVHRLDLVVEGKVVVELKAAKGIEDVHLATRLSYLHATRLGAGLILNFAGPKLAVRRVVYSAAEALRGGGAENLG